MATTPSASAAPTRPATTAHAPQSRARAAALAGGRNVRRARRQARARTGGATAGRRAATGRRRQARRRRSSSSAGTDATILTAPRSPRDARGRCSAYDACDATTDDGRRLAGAVAPTVARRPRHRLGGAAGLRRRRAVQRHGTRPRAGRPGVQQLEYEAYEEQVVPRLQAVADEARARWPTHRTGRAAAPRRASVPIGDRRRRGRRVGAASRRGVRRGPVLHRHGQGDRADLEARGVGRRRGWGDAHAAMLAAVAKYAGDAHSWVSFCFLLVPLAVIVGRLVDPRVAAPQAEAHARRASSRSSGRWTRCHPSDVTAQRADRQLSRLARDLAIDLGTANTLVYERGTRHRPERAVGDRAQQPHRRRAGDGPRGVADDRPHARLHRRRAAAARRRDHRLRHHAAHDPPAAAAGRRQPVQPAACRHLRAVGDHRGRAAGGHRGGPPRRRGRRAAASSSRWRRPSAPACRSTSRSATWSIDVGGGTSETALISLGGVVALQAVRVGSFDIDAAIQTYIRREYGIAVGERTAEEIKIAIGSA